MATFKLDGQEIPFEAGDTIIRAAWRQGVEVPHYCWHPGLSVAANCRMCLVEVKSDRPVLMPTLKWDAREQRYVPATKPKLVPSCQTPAVANQEVFAKSPDALTAQASVQEFLLLNHPVDCPICDQAGECKLQDYWLTSQGTLKRKPTEPVHKPKAVRFGPTIVYDAERCIMCTRCIRVSDEVAGDHVLDMRERGNRNEIIVSPGRELDHKYTLMTEHVCPVGALTSRDFRFKARVWFLRAKKSVCSGCATGCNTFMDHDPRDNRVYRLRPRDNMQVNTFWMCDDGMLTYQQLEKDRVLQGVIRDERAQAVAPEVALREAAVRLSGVPSAKVAVVLSAAHSTEDNFAALALARSLGTDKIYLAARAGWEGDKILRSADNNPNRRGVLQIAGQALPALGALLLAVREGSVLGVIALGSASTEDSAALAPLRQLTTISLTSNKGALSDNAAIVVPVAAHGEAAGSFVNEKGLTQRFEKAVAPPAGVLPGWDTVLGLAKAMGVELGFASLTDLRTKLGGAAGASTEARV